VSKQALLRKIFPFHSETPSLLPALYGENQAFAALRPDPARASKHLSNCLHVMSSEEARQFAGFAFRARKAKTGKLPGSSTTSRRKAVRRMFDARAGSGRNAAKGLIFAIKSGKIGRAFRL